MRKAIMVSMICFFIIVYSMIVETKALSKIYIKYCVCKEEILLSNTQILLSKFQDKIEVKKVMEIRNEYCKK